MDEVEDVVFCSVLSFQCLEAMAAQSPKPWPVLMG